jgi:hypothetical protein
MIRRIMLLFAAVALLALSLAPVVQAQESEPNPNAPFDAGFSIVLEANDPRFPGACDFPMLIEASGKGKEITLPNGSTILTSPGLHVTVTNLDNENQETYNVTGAVREETLANGDVVTRLTGRNFAIDPVAGVVVVAGNYTYTFDANGNLIEPLSGNGQLIDVCAALA